MTARPASPVARRLASERGVDLATLAGFRPLSCDPRILYGADAARFLARVRELLEQPFALLA